MLLAACGSRDDGPGDDARNDDLRIDPELIGSLSDDEAAEAAASSNAFGFGLHREIAEPGENTITSPLSASVLLAMVAAGAAGDTAEAMTEALHLDDPRDPRFAALRAELAEVDDVTLSVANSLWANEGTPLEDDYLDVARRTYGATLEERPLGEQATADEIDQWASDHTQGLIDEIAEDLGLPDPSVVLVLLNAVYFLGEWSEQFDPDDTREAPFTLADGEEVQVETMHRSGSGELAVREGYRMVRLPYGQDGRFGMEILLPDDDHDLDDLLEDLDLDEWQAAVDGLHESRISTLALPRFELEWDAELNDALDALGMGPAFASGSDFTPMSPVDPWLDLVVQKTYVRVDEAGTEAAAVTGGGMQVSAPPDVRVDRPFAFTVSDRDTGAILFLGSVHDPRG